MKASLQSLKLACIPNIEYMNQTSKPFWYNFGFTRFLKNYRL